MEANGTPIRSFSGGEDWGTALSTGHHLAFARDGRLLAGTSSFLLAFTEGGRSVRRIAEAACNQFTVAADGIIFMIQVEVRSIFVDSTSRKTTNFWRPAAQ